MDILPPASQRPLQLPSFIPNGALQALVSSRNPLQEHYTACFERLTFLAECEAMHNESSRVGELEEGVREVIDLQHDSEHIKEAVMATANHHAMGNIPQDTARSIFERAQVLKTNYRDLSDSQKYGHARPYDEFKRRVFDIEHPDDDYPGTASFFKRRNAGNHEQGSEGEEEEELEMTYHTKRNLKCPITMMTFKQPMRSKVCVHVYSRDAVMEMLRRNHGMIQCPVAGCDKTIRGTDLERDRVMERRVRDEEEEEGREGEALSSEAGDDVLDIL